MSEEKFKGEMPPIVETERKVATPPTETQPTPEPLAQVEAPKRKRERVEMNGEHIPGKAEVMERFAELIIGEYKIVDVETDEQGLFAFDVEIPGDTPTERTVYSYRRGVGGPQSLGKKCSIEIEYWDGEYPVNGETAADCFEGVWTIKTKPVTVKPRE